MGGGVGVFLVSGGGGGGGRVKGGGGGKKKCFRMGKIGPAYVAIRGSSLVQKKKTPNPNLNPTLWGGQRIE